ncbi:MAG: hypothetical protein HC904_11145 [Blastochloris sp.]|nr:hypothetical protein [Blastochloris sp.]
MENPLTLEDLPDEARQRYIAPTGRVLVEINPSENVWEREASERFVQDMRKVSPEATGTPVQNYTYIAILRDSYREAALFALAAILLTVGLHFRNLKHLALAMVPLIFGVIWTLGIMGLFGIQFNPANIITLPMVIGIGVAFGVYVVDRHLEEGKFALFGGSTGKAVFLSALTTIFGFACMMLGQHPGLVSLGLVMTLGVGFCFLSSAVILPQILVLMDGGKKRSDL